MKTLLITVLETMKILSYFLLVFTLLGFTSLSASSDGLPEIITVATGESPPYTGEKLQDQGSIAKLIVESFRYVGITAHMKFFPWKRAFTGTLQGSEDATAYWFRSEHRSQTHLYSDPITHQIGAWFYLASTDFDWQEEKDLRHFKVGAIAGYTHTPEFNQLASLGILNLTYVSTPDQLLQMLVAGRVDIIVESPDVIQALLKQHLRSSDEVELRQHPRPLYVTTGHLLIAKSHPYAYELIEQFNRGLMQYRQQYPLAAQLSTP